MTDGNIITENGKEYYRVTHILSKFKNRIDVDYKIWENKTRIGTDVHKAIECDLEGAFHVLEEGGLNYFESYKRWKEAQDKKGSKYEKSEFRLFDEDRRISGSFDLIVSAPDNQCGTLIDFKTCYAVDDMFWPLQGCFYYQLCIKNNIQVNPEVCFIKLDRKGGNPVIKIYTITKELEHIANSMLDIFFYLQK